MSSPLPKVVWRDQPTDFARNDFIDEMFAPEPPTIDNLDELARIIRTMTYGELTTLGEESGIDVRKLYGWSMK